MRAKVIRAFLDAQNAEKLYREGELFEGSPERVGELADKGFVQPIKTGGSRPSKSELLKELGETKTNPELAQMLDKVPPAKPASRKSKAQKE